MRETKLLPSPGNEQNRRIWFMVLAGLGALVVALTIYFRLEPAATGFDQSLLTFSHAHQSSGLTTFLKLATHLGGVASMFILSALTTIYLWLRVRDQVPFFVAAVGGVTVVMELIKHLVLRPRPELYPWLVSETGYSFPSGHAAGDLSFFLALFLIIELRWPHLRWPLAAVGLVWIFVVGVSRIYLQIHYPTDIIAGWLLGLVWTLWMWRLTHKTPA